MRTIVDIPTADIAALDAISRRRRVSRAAVIREAVARTVREDQDEGWRAAIGSWKGWFHEDSVEYVNRIRAEWGD